MERKSVVGHFSDDNLSKERAVDKIGPNGTKEKLENRKPFNHCCYCFAENCLVKLDLSRNGHYVRHLQWDVSGKQRGRQKVDVKRRRLNCVCL